MEWISVKDKLPEDAKKVIAYRPRTNQIVFATYIGTCWLQNGGIIAKNAISHWIPLPDRPIDK